MSINTSGQHLYNPFRIKGRDILWALKVFSASAAGAYLLSTLVYIFMLLLSEPEPVNSAIATTAVTATAKVEVAARYINPFLSIFLFNTIAALTASAGPGIFLSIHNIMIKEMEFRSGHRRYASLSIKMEKALKPFPNLLKHIFPINRQPPIIEDQDLLQPNQSIWDFCGYTKHEYRLFARMLPHIVPTLMLIANGILVGMLLSFFLFNGAVEGYGFIGTSGIALGILYNLAYFVASILPHGIIELPALFMAAALGHRFAWVQSNLIADEGLFLGDDKESMRRNVSKINSITREYLGSRYLWILFGMLTIFLLLAAYVEAYVTAGVVEDVMVAVEMAIEGIFNADAL